MTVGPIEDRARVGAAWARRRGRWDARSSRAGSRLRTRHGGVQRFCTVGEPWDLSSRPSRPPRCPRRHPWPLADHLERARAPGRDPRRRARRTADRMLIWGSRPRFERILRVAPSNRQHSAFCDDATEVERLVRRHLVRPARIRGRPGGPAVAGVTQVLSGRTPRGNPAAAQAPRRRARSDADLHSDQHRADRVARAVTAAGHRAARLACGPVDVRSGASAPTASERRYRVLHRDGTSPRGASTCRARARRCNFDLRGARGLHPFASGGPAGPRRAAFASSFARPRSRTPARDRAPHLATPLVAG